MRFISSLVAAVVRELHKEVSVCVTTNISRPTSRAVNIVGMKTKY